MRRFFVQNIFFLILVNLIVKPLWIFGIDRNVQNVVGHEVFGQYQALLNLSLIFQVLLDFGLQSYNSRTIAQSPQTLPTLFPNIIMAKGILSLGYIVMIILIGLLMGYRGYAFFLLLGLSLVQILTSFLLYFRSNISAMHHFKKDSFLSVADRLIMIAICSVLLFHPSFSERFRIEWFIYAQIVAYLLTGIIAFLICSRLSRLDWQHYDLRKVWVICKSSLPYAVLILLMAIYIRSDVALMERLLPDGKYQAGVYAAAYRFLDVANNISGVLFAGMLLPIFGGMLAKKEKVQPLVRLSVNLLMPVAITTVVTALLLGKEIMKMNYTNAKDYDGEVFSLLMIAFPAYCIGYVYSTLLTANGNLRQLIVVASCAVIINLTLNLTLMHQYGALAAAFSCCVTQFFVAGANIFLSKKILGLKTDSKWVLQYILFAGLIFIAVWGILKLTTSLLWHLVFIAAAGACVMFLCGFLPLGKIRELLKNK